MRTRVKHFSKSVAEYNADTGDFIWLYCHRKPWMNGKLAGRMMNNEYIYIKADGAHHSASRLAWSLYHDQPIPDGMVIDHINKNRSDNRIENLRLLTWEDNRAQAVPAIGQSGVRGIRIYNRPSGNGFVWRVMINGQIKYFRTVEDAKLASEACSS